MTRHTVRRVEVAAPIYDASIRDRILSMFRVMMEDTVKARIQQPDGTYLRQMNAKIRLNAQEYFYEQAYRKAMQMNTASTESNVQN